MAETVKPILFNTQMVEAILKGHKTQTRRLLKPQPYTDGVGVWYWKGRWNFPWTGIEQEALYKPGDILWVRETWARQFGLYWHKAGLEVDENGYCKDGYWAKDAAAPGGKIYIATKAPERWKPSIHMPKEAARIFLRVTGVRVERLQVIENIAAEGITLFPADNRLDPRYYFIKMWDSLISPADRDECGWAANPWVWVYKFERCGKPEGW